LELFSPATRKLLTMFCGMNSRHSRFQISLSPQVTCYSVCVVHHTSTAYNASSSTKFTPRWVLGVRLALWDIATSGNLSFHSRPINFLSTIMCRVYKQQIIVTRVKLNTSVHDSSMRVFTWPSESESREQSLVMPLQPLHFSACQYLKVSGAIIYVTGGRKLCLHSIFRPAMSWLV
jgi:hypothetical protein